MSVKRHCEVCDATQPDIPLDGWLHVEIEQHLPFRSMTYGMHGMLVGDYCSDVCLLRRMLSIPTRCAVLEQTMTNHRQENP